MRDDGPRDDEEDTTSPAARVRDGEQPAVTGRLRKTRPVMVFIAARKDRAYYILTPQGRYPPGGPRPASFSRGLFCEMPSRDARRAIASRMS